MLLHLTFTLSCSWQMCWVHKSHLGLRRIHMTLRVAERLCLRYDVSTFVMHLHTWASYIHVNLQRVCQGKQQKIAKLKEQITAAQTKVQKYQSEMQALKTQDSVPEDMLKAQEELEANERAEVKRLQMKLPEVTHNQELACACSTVCPEPLMCILCAPCNEMSTAVTGYLFDCWCCQMHA